MCRHGQRARMQVNRIITENYEIIHRSDQLKQLKEASEITILVSQPINQDFLKLMSQLKKIGSIRSIEIRMNQSLQIIELFQALSIGISKKIKLTNLVIDYHPLFIDKTCGSNLANCFSKNLQDLNFLFRKVSKTSIKQILDGLKVIKNLQSFYLEILETCLLEVKSIFEAISQFSQLKKLKLISSSEIEEIKSFNLMPHITQCERIELSVYDMVHISSFKNTDSIKKIYLQLVKTDQSILDLFSQIHLPNLQHLQTLKFNVKYNDQSILEFMKLLILRISGLRRLSIDQCSINGYQLRELLSLVALNNQITQFTLRSGYSSAQELKEEDILPQLGNIKNLSIAVRFPTLKYNQNFMRHIKKLDQLQTLSIQNRGIYQCSDIYKIKRLVLLK